MIDCENFGEIVIYNRKGQSRTIDHENTVKLCKKAQEEGTGIEEIIKREIEPDLKMLKFVWKYDCENRHLLYLNWC